MLIALSGDRGVEGQPHLHFEIQRVYSATQVSPNVAGIEQLWCWDETSFAWRDSARICLPADPYGWSGVEKGCDSISPCARGSICLRDRDCRPESLVRFRRLLIEQAEIGQRHRPFGTPPGRQRRRRGVTVYWAWRLRPDTGRGKGRSLDYQRAVIRSTFIVAISAWVPLPLS